MSPATANPSMDGADLVIVEASRQIVAAYNAGEPLDPIVIEAHRQFGRCAVEVWWLAWGHYDPAHRSSAWIVRDQLETVGKANAKLFGLPERPTFDDECRKAVLEAANKREGELRTGWCRR